MLVTERHCVQAWYVELVPTIEHPTADEGHVEVARARPVGVERRVVRPTIPRDRASPENDRAVFGCYGPKTADEVIVSRAIAIEGQLDHALDRLLLRFFRGPCHMASSYGNAGAGHLERSGGTARADPSLHSG